jgi:molybdopterin-biosynthesis enzyme MoeA-like protein
VMAGVPMVMRAMMEEILPRLPRGVAVQSITISAALAEGTIAQGLAEIQKAYPQAVIGSYPWYRDGKFGAQLVARSRDVQAMEAAANAIEAMIIQLGATPERVSSA